MDHSRHSRASQRLKRHGNTLAIRLWICLDLFAELAIVRSRGERGEGVLPRRRISYNSFIARFLHTIHSHRILRIVAARRLRPASGRKISSRNCELVGVDSLLFLLFLQIWVGAWLNAIGAIVRYLSRFGRSYPIVIVGQILCAAAQPFILFAPTKLASFWFPDDQRALATMLSTMGTKEENAMMP